MECSSRLEFPDIRHGRNGIRGLKELESPHSSFWLASVGSGVTVAVDGVYRDALDEEVFSKFRQIAPAYNCAIFRWVTRFTTTRHCVTKEQPP